MKQYIGCDAHARYLIFVSIDEKGKASPPVRVEHDELEVPPISEQFTDALASGVGEFRELVLAGSGHGRGWLRAALGACLGSKKTHAGAEQDGHAGCDGAGDSGAQSCLAGSVDSTGEAIGHSRSDAYPAIDTAARDTMLP